jgi:hypothetical protein
MCGLRALNSGACSNLVSANCGARGVARAWRCALLVFWLLQASAAVLGSLVCSSHRVRCGCVCVCSPVCVVWAPARVLQAHAVIGLPGTSRWQTVCAHLYRLGSCSLNVVAWSYPKCFMLPLCYYLSF